MPTTDDACSGYLGSQTDLNTQSPLLMKVKLGRPRKGTVAPTACLSEDDKKGRRRAANRESARRMRARRAENVAQLTTQVNELKNKCERLHSHNQAIRLNWKKVALENNRLRAHFEAMQNSLGPGAALAIPEISTSPPLPPELDEAPVTFDDCASLSTGQTSSTNDTDLLSCLTPGFRSSPDPSSQPAVSSPGAQQVPQLPTSFTPPCSPSCSQPLLPDTISPFASTVPQAPSSSRVRRVPPSSSSAPRLKPTTSAPQSASLPPQWGASNTNTHSLSVPSNTNSTSHGTVILDPLPTVTSSNAGPHHNLPPHSTQPCSLPPQPPRLSHPLTLRTDLLPEHLPPSLHHNPQHPSPAPWAPPFHPASAPPPNPSLPSLLDALDATFPFPSATPDLHPDPTHHHHAPPHHAAPHLAPRSYSKQMDAMPSLNAFPRSFSKHLEAVPSLGPGDPLQRLFSQWDILSTLPPNRQASLDPMASMASMGSLPLLDDQNAFLPPDLHAPPHGHGVPDSAASLHPRMNGHPAFFR